MRKHGAQEYTQHTTLVRKVRGGSYIYTCIHTTYVFLFAERKMEANLKIKVVPSESKKGTGWRGQKYFK